MYPMVKRRRTILVGHEVFELLCEEDIDGSVTRMNP